MATNLVHGGKVSPVQFMDYTLGALFYRFISENITDYCNHLMKEAGVDNADYLHMSDEMAENARNQIVKAKGFFIKPSQLFKNVADNAKSSPDCFALTKILWFFESKLACTPASFSLEMNWLTVIVLSTSIFVVPPVFVLT